MARTKILRASVLALMLGTPLGGCIVNPYKDVEPGYFSYGHALTAADVYHQDTEVIPRCTDWAENTNPKDWKMMGSYAINNMQGGLVGGAAGYAADSLIVGALTTLKTVAGSGSYYMLAAGGVGAVQGKQTNDYVKHADKKWCAMADAAGYHFYSPEYGHVLLIKAQQQGWRPPAPGTEVSQSQLPTDQHPVLPPQPPAPEGGS